MNIHAIYAEIFKLWRHERMLKFERMMNPSADEVVLDVGGRPETWTTRPQITKRIDCLNPSAARWGREFNQTCRITTVVGDGCALTYEDSSYDILYSNSFIEHVGDFEMQRAFARESRRVGKKLWIQTPALECPLEPHFLTPLVHWLPVFVRRRVLRWFTPWGWLTKPNQKKVDETIASTRLLTKRRFKQLFPDCDVMTERLFGVFAKSYIAYRKHK